MKMKILKLIMIFLFICSCNKNKNSIEIENLITSWIDKEIIFPTDISCVSINKDTLCIPPKSTAYKILVYTDSVGCISCKLQLYKWNMLIKEVQDEMSDLVNFQFYFQPKDKKALNFLFKRDAFTYPAYIDTKGQLNKLNNLPKDHRFQTFLLDENNKILLIGNPADSPRIWELYKKTINGDKELISTSDRTKFTTIEVEQQMIELEGLEIHKTNTASFTLKNTGDNPLLITDVSASCGCTIPEWTKKPILPNESTSITVQVTPDSKDYFRKTITVFCNIEKRSITLVVKGVVNDK